MKAKGSFKSWNTKELSDLAIHKRGIICKPLAFAEILEKKCTRYCEPLKGTTKGLRDEVFKDVLHIKKEDKGLYERMIHVLKKARGELGKEG